MGLAFLPWAAFGAIVSEVCRGLPNGTRRSGRLPANAMRDVLERPLRPEVEESVGAVLEPPVSSNRQWRTSKTPLEAGLEEVIFRATLRIVTPIYIVVCGSARIIFGKFVKPFDKLRTPQAQRTGGSRKEGDHMGSPLRDRNGAVLGCRKTGVCDILLLLNNLKSKGRLRGECLNV